VSAIDARGGAFAALAGGLSHELNNLLSAVLMLVDILEATRASERERQLLAAMGESARRGVGLVRQLHGLSRGDAQEGGPFQPRHLLLDVEKAARAVLSPHAAVSSHLAADLWLLTGDPVHLYEGCLDLCLAAGEGEGDLALAAWNEGLDEVAAAQHPGLAAGPHVVVEVARPGCRSSFPAGAALHFAACGGVAETLPAAAGSGVAFRVHLPAAPLPAADPAPAATPAGRGELVLVVESDPALRRALAAALEQNGYAALPAADGAEGVARFAAHLGTAAAVIVGADLRFLTGPGVAHAVRHLRPQVPVLPMGTAGELAAWPAEPGEEGVAAQRLVKPFGVAELLAALGRLLAGDPPAP
jgi:two-component system cell cycle sensor histidine kinase/response regulator CckA